MRHDVEARAAADSHNFMVAFPPVKTTKRDTLHLNPGTFDGTTRGTKCSQRRSQQQENDAGDKKPRSGVVGQAMPRGRTATWNREIQPHI